MTNRPLLKKLDQLRAETEALRELQDRADRRQARDQRRNLRWVKAGVLLAFASIVPTTNIANAVAHGSYVAGYTLATIGVVSLSQHVENPGQHPLKDRLVDLGFGGILPALPPLVGRETDFGDFGIEI